MEHNKYKEQLILMVYGELEQSELENLHKHIDECAECRQEAARLQKVREITENSIAAEVDEKLLFEARTRLRNSLDNPYIPDERHSLFSFGFLYDLFVPGRGWTLARVLPFVLVGIAIGIVLKFNERGDSNSVTPVPLAVNTNAGDESKDSFDSSGIRIENLKVKDADASDGEVAISFDAVKSVQLKGSPDNKLIQKVLYYSALNSKHDGERIAALNKIAANNSMNPQLKSALIDRIKTDENPGVRREALLLLCKNGYDSQIENTLLYVLNNDKNPGLRVMAIKALQNGISSSDMKGTDNKNNDLIETLKNKSRNDGNKFVQINARTVLQEVMQ